MSNGTETVLTPCSGDDWMIAAGKRVLARMTHTAAMAGVPGLRWNVSAAFARPGMVQAGLRRVFTVAMAPPAGLTGGYSASTTTAVP